MRLRRARSSMLHQEEKARRSTRKSSVLRNSRLEQLEERALMAVINVDPLAADGATNSLRWAINQANANAQSDTLVMPAGTYSMSLNGTIEDNNVRGDFDLKEAGYSI